MTHRFTVVIGIPTVGNWFGSQSQIVLDLVGRGETYKEMAADARRQANKFRRDLRVISIKRVTKHG